MRKPLRGPSADDGGLPDATWRPRAQRRRPDRPAGASARGADRSPVGPGPGGRRARRNGTRPAALHPLRSRGPGAARRHRLRRGELERHRHRLHLRRPRHLQEVQGPDRRRQRAGPAPRRALLHERAARRRLAAGLPRAGDRRPHRRGPAPDDPAQGGDRRRRSAGDPAAGDPEAVRRAVRADALRPAARPGPAARRYRRPRAPGRHPRAAPAPDGGSARPISSSRRWLWTTCSSTSSLGTPPSGGMPSPSTSGRRPWWPPCSTRPRAPRQPWRRCSTSSSPSART